MAVVLWLPSLATPALQPDCDADAEPAQYSRLGWVKAPVPRHIFSVCILPTAGPVGTVGTTLRLAPPASARTICPRLDLGSPGFGMLHCTAPYRSRCLERGCPCTPLPRVPVFGPRLDRRS